LTHDNKLVASVSADSVTAAHHSAQSARNNAEELIASIVIALVVYGLKVI
jgi:hypothetical protein